MRLRNLILALALVAFATPALAVVKVYNGVSPGGIVGDALLYTTGGCPPIQITPGRVQGEHAISDTGAGSVTLTDFRMSEIVLTDIGPEALLPTFGPGAFVFIDATTTVRTTTLPVSAPGSTAPGGSVAWGILSGFTNTGVAFCLASPQTVCTGGAMVPHGTSSPLGAINSPTYDLGTWSFDAEGDLTASPYIIRTAAGGVTNGQILIRGAYVGAAIPALPVIGAGALALSLAVAGARTLVRKK